MTPDFRAMCSHPLAQEAYVAFVQICKGGSDDAGTYDADEEIVRRALKRLDELESALLDQQVAEGPTDEELEEEFGAALLKLSGDSMNATAVAFARAVLARFGGRPAAAPAPEPGEVPRIGHILRLAEIIREVDGRHDKGAAALAEAILSHPGICSAGLAALAEADGPAVPESREPASVALQPSDGDVRQWVTQCADLTRLGWTEHYWAFDVSDDHVCDIARAALARWGRPAAAPVPVSERPWECQGWCDKDGWCWFGWADEPDASWSFCKPSERGTATVSLPAHALPIPEAND